MKKITFTLALIAFTAWNASAKIWRVNNNPGVVTGFTTVDAAIGAAAAGDTIYVEGSATNYGGFTLNKRVVIIGTGYFLSGANSNPGLQANTNPSSFGNGYVVFDSTGTGSQLIGLSNFYMALGYIGGSATDNITISRCYFTGIGTYYAPTANTIMNGWTIDKCYINGGIGGNIGVTQNWNVRNNIFTGAVDMSNAANSGHVIRNNVFRTSLALYNAYFANNIIANATTTLVNVVVKNNLAIGTPGGFASYVGTNGNTQGYTDTQIFQGLTGNSTDGQWRLAASSPAIGAGLTVGSVVNPDAGAFGGPDPYKLSGIPHIPTIYSLTVPASIPSGTNSMSVTLSTRNNN